MKGSPICGCSLATLEITDKIQKIAMSMTTSLQRIARNFCILLSGQAVVTALAFVALGLNTRALGIEDLGRLFLVQAACELTSKVIAFQNWQTFIKLGAEDGAGTAETMGLWVFGVALDFLAAAIAAGAIAVVFVFFPGLVGLDPETASWSLMYVASLLVSGTGTCIGTLRLYERFGQVVAVNTLQAVLLLASAAVLYHMSAPLKSYLIAIPAIIAFCSLLMIALGLRSILQQIPVPRHYWPAAAERRTFLSFAFGVSASATLSAFRQRGEVLLVGVILGPAAAALYGVAYRLSALIARFAQSARISVYPEFSKMVAQNAFPEALALAKKLTRWTGLAGLSIIAAVVVAGEPALALLFGAEFAAAYPNLVLLATGTCIYTATFALGPLVQIAFGSWRFFAMNVIAFAGFVIFGALGPYLFDAAGAGAGAAAFSCILAALLVMQIRRQVRSRSGG